MCFLFSITAGLIKTSLIYDLVKRGLKGICRPENISLNEKQHMLASISTEVVQVGNSFIGAIYREKKKREL